MCSNNNFVPCPLCSQATFSSIDSLRISLIKAANGPLTCPICREILLGLDKLTIHLFSHTTLISSSSTVTSGDFTNPDNNENASKISRVEHPNTNTEKRENSYLNCNKVNNSAVNIEVSTAAVHTLSPSTSVSSPIAPNGSVPATLHGIPSSVSGDNVYVDPPPQTTSNTSIISTVPGPVLTGTIVVIDGSKCDICELQLANSETLKMHNRLVHPKSQINNVKPPQITEESIINNSGNQKFQCHLCAKIFKMKGSLRVHLKVVHLLGVSSTQKNTPKLTILEKIRKKNETITDELIAHPQFSETRLQEYTNGGGVESSRVVATVPLTDSILRVAKNKYDKTNSTSVMDTALRKSNVPTRNDENLLQNLMHTNQNKVIFASTSISGSLEKSSTGTTDGGSIEKLFPSGGNGSPKGLESTKIWECDVCSKSFTTKYFLKKHKRLHTGEMPYTCELCGKTFTFQQSYHKHLLYHSDEKPHVCQTCGRAFKELSTLHNHERIHSGEKPFKCETCGKCFRQRVSYLVHKRIHTGVMPYKCQLCNKSFRYKVSQRTHKCIALQSGNGSVELTSNLCSLQDSTATSSPLSTTMQTNDFLQKFLENTTILPEIRSNHSPSGNTVVEEGMKTNEEEMLSKSIDEIVEESCKKMGINDENEDERRREKITRTSSPSEKFQNLHLCSYSPVEDAHRNDSSGGIVLTQTQQRLETINEDSLKQLLYGVKSYL